jgi:hypothetical protein
MAIAETDWYERIREIEWMFTRLHQELYCNKHWKEFNRISYLVNQELIDIEARIQPSWGGRLMVSFTVPDIGSDFLWGAVHNKG